MRWTWESWASKSGLPCSVATLTGSSWTESVHRSAPAGWSMPSAPARIRVRSPPAGAAASLLSCACVHVTSSIRFHQMVLTGLQETLQRAAAIRLDDHEPRQSHHALLARHDASFDGERGNIARSTGGLDELVIDNAEGPGEHVDACAELTLKHQAGPPQLIVDECRVLLRVETSLFHLEVRMPVGMRLDLDQAAGHHPANLFPGQGIVFTGNHRRIQEQRDADLLPEDDGIELGVD